MFRLERNCHFDADLSRKSRNRVTVSVGWSSWRWWYVGFFGWSEDFGCFGLSLEWLTDIMIRRLAEENRTKKKWRINLGSLVHFIPGLRSEQGHPRCAIRELSLKVPLASTSASVKSIFLGLSCGGVYNIQ